MIDPFSALLGVLMGIAMLSLWIEFLDRWRQRGDDLVDELAEVERVLTSAIKSGLDDADGAWSRDGVGHFPEPDEDATRPIRPVGWTHADEFNLIRARFFERSTE